MGYLDVVAFSYSQDVALRAIRLTTDRLSIRPSICVPGHGSMLTSN